MSVYIVCTLTHTGHHAQNPPGASLSRHNGVEIAHSNVNRPDRYLVLNETSVNVQHDCQGNCSIPHSANKQVLDGKYVYVQNTYMYEHGI
jgi:hypothetical protein